jgi:hypothetical protein
VTNAVCAALQLSEYEPHDHDRDQPDCDWPATDVRYTTYDDQANDDTSAADDDAYAYKECDDQPTIFNITNDDDAVTTLPLHKYKLPVVNHKTTSTTIVLATADTGCQLPAVAPLSLARELGITVDTSVKLNAKSVGGDSIRVLGRGSVTVCAPTNLSEPDAHRHTRLQTYFVDDKQWQSEQHRLLFNPMAIQTNCVSVPSSDTTRCHIVWTDTATKTRCQLSGKLHRRAERPSRQPGLDIDKAASVTAVGDTDVTRIDIEVPVATTLWDANVFAAFSDTGQSSQAPWPPAHF